MHTANEKCSQQKKKKKKKDHGSRKMLAAKEKFPWQNENAGGKKERGHILWEKKMLPYRGKLEFQIP